MQSYICMYCSYIWYYFRTGEGNSGCLADSVQYVISWSPCPLILTAILNVHNNIIIAVHIVLYVNGMRLLDLILGVHVYRWHKFRVPVKIQNFGVNGNILVGGKMREFVLSSEHFGNLRPKYSKATLQKL